MVTERWARVARAARQPVSAASLVAYRAAFGLLMFAGVVRFVAAGWVDGFYVTPELTLGYPGLEWIQPLSRVGMYSVFAALGVLALLIAAGVWARGAALLFAVGFTYVELLDQTCYLNHYYLVSLLALLLSVLPIRRGVAAVPRAWLWTLRAQVGLVYVFAGVAKLAPDWLLDAQPLSIWLSTMELPIVDDLVARPWVAYLASWFGAAFDLAIVPLLLWRRTRVAAFSVAIGFHVVTWLMFPIGLFPWIMIANATLFFAPDWPTRGPRLLRAWERTRRRDPRATLGPAFDLPRRGRFLGAVLAIHFALQIAIPLRHLAYPGDVLWTEEGLRFAWKVMIVEKAGIARFEVRDPPTGRQWTIYPRQYLTARQEKMLSVQPELIRQFAHHLQREFAARGIAAVEVRADVEVAMNGRRRRRLIDPAVDLAREPFSWSPYAWIVR
jgi:vitamin K-dependent gamma-carboxylase